MSHTTNTAEDFQTETVDQSWVRAFDIAASNDDTAVYASIDDALISMVGLAATPAVRDCKCQSSLHCWTVATSCTVGAARGRRS